MNVHESVKETFQDLERLAPGVPLLALGQTVFWDEPLKACLPALARAAGQSVALVAGVHDTDYFAKLPGGLDSRESFVALPRNDGTTKGFWSAAGEFSALFGSETPVTREALAAAGVSLDRLTAGDPRAVDRETEAWGWRGIASADPAPRTTSQIALRHAFETLQATLVWAMNETVDRLSEPGQHARSREAADKLREISCDTRTDCPGQTLADFYECMLPKLHSFVMGEPVTASITKTSDLLRFTPESASLPRFRFVDLFLNPQTASIAKEAYDEAVAGTEVYSLERFGTGAIPFDFILSEHGRGTIRLTNQMLIVVTPTPQFVKLDKPIESIEELAAVANRALGPCILVGKAIPLISMLAAEFVFAFHEGASTYVSQTKRMNDALVRKGVQVHVNPILRIGHEAWDALCGTDVWLRLPVRLRAPFGAEVVSGQTIGRAWRCVADQQRAALSVLSQARNTSALIDALHSIKGGRWETLAAEYASIRSVLQPLAESTTHVRAEVAKIHQRLRAIKAEWAECERSRGEAFRNKDAATRDRMLDSILSLRNERRNLRETLAALRAQHADAAAREEVVAARQRRRDIAREAEHARLRCVQEAIMATTGMERTNRRPAAWWIPLVSPDGAWLHSMLSRVQLRLEPLVS